MVRRNLTVILVDFTHTERQNLLLHFIFMTGIQHNDISVLRVALGAYHNHCCYFYISLL